MLNRPNKVMNASQDPVNDPGPAFVRAQRRM